MVLLDQRPLAGLVRGGFTRDDDVLSVLGGLLARVGVLLAARRVRVLSVEGDAGLGGVVEARGLFGGVVAEADGEELLTVGAAHVERAGLDVLGAQDVLLKGDDGLECRDERGEHFGRRVCLFPSRGGRSGQVRHVQGSEVLRVRGALDVFVLWLGQQGEHDATDVRKVGDEAVVHDGVPAKGEGVVVDGGDRRPRRGADVRKHGRRRRVAAYAVEVGVVGRWLGVLVHGGPDAGGRADEVGPRGRVPCHAEAVDVEETVAQRDLFTRGLFAGGVREEFGQVVVVHLFGEAVFGRDQHVFEETFLRGRDVGEPSTHCGETEPRYQGTPGTWCGCCCVVSCSPRDVVVGAKRSSVACARGRSGGGR